MRVEPPTVKGPGSQQGGSLMVGVTARVTPGWSERELPLTLGSQESREDFEGQEMSAQKQMSWYTEITFCERKTWEL